MSESWRSTRSPHRRGRSRSRSVSRGSGSARSAARPSSWPSVGWSVGCRALAKESDRLLELSRVKVGPKRAGEVELGTRQLVEQKIRKPVFPARTNEQIRIGHPAGREI